MNKKILLVGGSGYIGRHLKRALTISNISVYTTGTQELTDPNHYLIDFNSPKTFNSLGKTQFDIIILLASKIDSIKTKNLNHSDLESNVLGFSKFLHYLNENRTTSKFVYISSMTVYSHENESPVLETGSLAPLHTYGLSKLLAENVFNFFCKTSSFSGVIFRLPGIYGGDREDGFIYNLIDKFISKEKILLESKNLGFWETIHVEDLMAMMIKFLEKYNWPTGIDVFNISYGEETDFYATAHKVSQIMNCEKLLETSREKNYTKLFISNKKISVFTSPPMSYWSRLDQYVKSFV